jgi:uncharacterized protein YecT (DUF1311 family)
VLKSQNLGKSLCWIALLSAASLAGDQQRATGQTYVEPEHAPECQANALALSRCEAIRAEHSGKHLERLIAEVTAALPLPGRERSFGKANAEWARFRNASCEFDSEAASGSSGAYRYVACVHSYNKSRIVLLEKYLGCLKGGCSNDVQLYYLVSPP